MQLQGCSHLIIEKTGKDPWIHPRMIKKKALHISNYQLSIQKKKKKQFHAMFHIPRVVNQGSSKLVKVAVTSLEDLVRLCATLVLHSFDTVLLI